MEVRLTPDQEAFVRQGNALARNMPRIASSGFGGVAAGQSFTSSPRKTFWMAVLDSSKFSVGWGSLWILRDPKRRFSQLANPFAMMIQNFH
jgi:hypothetical protein